MPRERVNSQHLTFRIGFCHKKYAYQEKGTRDSIFSLERSQEQNQGKLTLSSPKGFLGKGTG